MAIHRVQLVRTFAGAPAIGRWNAYTTFWFDAPSNFDWHDPVIADRVLRLANGQGPTQTAAHVVQYGYASGANAGRIIVYELVGSSLVFRSDERHTLSPLGHTSSVGSLKLPWQCSICVGYRRAAESVRQRGRSRWFIGPVSINSNSFELTGSIRLTSNAVQLLVTNTMDTIDAFDSDGARMLVHSGRGASQSVSDVVEIFVDDVIDVRRSRRPWQLAQFRSDTPWS